VVWGVLRVYVGWYGGAARLKRLLNVSSWLKLTSYQHIFMVKHDELSKLEFFSLIYYTLPVLQVIAPSTTNFCPVM